MKFCMMVIIYNNAFMEMILILNITLNKQNWEGIYWKKKKKKKTKFTSNILKKKKKKKKKEAKKPLSDKQKNI